MRYSAEHKAQTRERILDESGVLVRQAGLLRLGVARAMRKAGLTVGGFYNHFGSRSRFVADTLRHTLEQSRVRLTEGLTELEGQAFLESFVRRYLSRSHRDDVDRGCPLPATLSELPAAGAPSQRVLAEELEKLVGDLTAQLPGSDEAARRQRAFGVFALCVGGLSLSRALGDNPLSEEILRACRRLVIPPR